MESPKTQWTSIACAPSWNVSPNLVIEPERHREEGTEHPQISQIEMQRVRIPLFLICVICEICGLSLFGIRLPQPSVQRSAAPRALPPPALAARESSP